MRKPLHVVRPARVTAPMALLGACLIAMTAAPAEARSISYAEIVAGICRDAVVSGDLLVGPDAEGLDTVSLCSCAGEHIQAAAATGEMPYFETYATPPEASLWPALTTGLTACMAQGGTNLSTIERLFNFMFE